MGQNFTKETPFLTSIKERKRLTSSSSEKETWHVVLDLKGSGITYEPGDCVGVIPVNAPEVVAQTLAALQATGKEEIVAPKTQETLCFHDYLTRKGNLTNLNKKFIKALLERQPNEAKQERLTTLLADREGLHTYLEEHELWDLLEEHSEVTFTPQEIADLLPPLLPRFYSIASSKHVVGEEVHLTVRHLEYTAREIRRQGVCTHYLCDLVPLGDAVVPIFIQPAHAFGLPPEPETPMMMVGPGTGVAPYRAFLQERLATGAKGPNWLFFGEWRREHDYYYGDYFEELASNGHLKLDTAFSRDQQEKVYVQHLMEQKGHEVWEWLQKGGYFYVCGDAKRMAKDVDATLTRIVEQHGQMESADARAYIKSLRREKRYLTDVY